MVRAADDARFAAQVGEGDEGEANDEKGYSDPYDRPVAAHGTVLPGMTIRLACERCPWCGRTANCDPTNVARRPTRSRCASAAAR